MNGLNWQPTRVRVSARYSLDVGHRLTPVQQTRGTSHSPDLPHDIVPQTASSASCQSTINGDGVTTTPSMGAKGPLHLRICTPHVCKELHLNAREAVTPSVPRPPIGENGLTFSRVPVTLVLVRSTSPPSLAAAVAAAE